MPKEQIMESNGEYKLIIYRLDELTKICQNINTQMTDTIRTNAKQDMDINEIGTKAGTTQTELREHKKDEKWFIVLGVGIASTIATLFARFWHR